MGLRPLPPTFARTRLALHRIAEEVVAPARKPHNEIALIRTPGGFGTPPFEQRGRSLQVRVEGAELVVDEDAEQRRAPITTVAAAAELVGEDLFPDGMPADAEALEVDPVAAERLADFYELGDRILRAFLELTPEADRPSPISLWPEHFDIAIESGPEDLGRRANYGASPGDEEHAEPYVYVGPWTAQAPGELWNATAFPGGELLYAELVDAADPDALAGEFFSVRREALDG